MIEPKVSVIIPVYGVEKYIEKCLRSCFTNTIAKDCEFLIIDDCSCDNSIAVAKNVIDEFTDLNIRIITHKKNKGLAAARNTGLFQSRGEYLINVDSDDWVENNYLENLYNKAKSGNYDVVCCDLIREYKNCSCPEKEVIPNNPREALSLLIKGKISGYTVLRLIKRKLFFDNNFSWIEGLNMCEDLLIMTKVFYYAKSIFYMEKNLYHYNCTNLNSLSYSLNDNKIEQLLKVSVEIEKFIKDKNIYNSLKKDLITQKARFKVWITKCSIDKKNEYFDLYNDEQLYKDTSSSIIVRFFLLCCNLHLYKLSKILININLFIKKKK